MSTTYCPVPLNEECAAWLDAERVSHPPVSASYRNPTPTEIIQVLGSLRDYQYEICTNLEHRTWDAHLSWAANPSRGPSTTIALADYRGDDSPCQFCFYGGWLEVIFLVLERLSHICGPLALADGACGIPYLIQPGTGLDIMIREYETRSSPGPVEGQEWPGKIAER
jgi:hypothetical protein